LGVKRKMELLAPGGDIDSIKAAILAGTDAVYCGLTRFNARNSAANIRFEELPGILRLAHKNNCKVFLTLNISILESEIPAVIVLLNKLVNTSIDGIIVQDPGLFYLLSTYFQSLKVHASTQLNTHNEGQVHFLSELKTTCVNLSRELNIGEIQSLTSIAHQNDILTEVFVHGSNCLSFSGICYFSSVHGGNSGNRGRCSQPCRDQYLTTPAGKDYPLNLKDNSAFFELRELSEAGVDSLKIEGRIKKFDYVYRVVQSWRKQLGIFEDNNQVGLDKSDLYKVFNRDFSNSFLKGEIGREMFIDNPRDHSINHLNEVNEFSSASEMERGHIEFYEEKEKEKAVVEKCIRLLSIAKAPVSITLSGECDSPLKMDVTTPEFSFVLLSKINLSDTGHEVLNYDMIMKRLKAIDDTEYYMDHLNLDSLHNDCYIPFKELTSLKKRLLFVLNGSRETIDPIDVSFPESSQTVQGKPTLSVLISSVEEVKLYQDTPAILYFQLPDCFKNESGRLTDFFIKNPSIVPWFPSILIGEDYSGAVAFLLRVRPARIVTNNTGIAYEAYKNGIAWIAGPSLNITNSFALLCLKEQFNCSGAFISGEISKIQMQQIKKPAGFKLFYRIFHPNLLMTSRHCLFHQVAGCEKERMDAGCLQSCVKSATITNLKKETFLIEKSKDNYHRIYDEYHFLNTEIVTDLPDLFDGFFVDLNHIKTKSKIDDHKRFIIEAFENLLNGEPDSGKLLKQKIYPSVCTQYLKGI